MKATRRTSRFSPFSLGLLFLIAVSGIGIFFSLPAKAKPSRSEIIEVSEIRPGMKGYGLSVFRGQGVERFEVEVVAVVPNALLREDIILVRCQGQNLEQTMIIAGMSGSPVFIEGRLAGALAYGWSFAREPIAGVTPIRVMLDTLEKFSTAPPAVSRGFTLPGRRDNTADLFPPSPAESRSQAISPGGSFAPIAAPLFVAGISPAGLELLRGELEPFHLIPVMAGGISGSELDPEAAANLGPGSAVGVALMMGDISMVAVGTLTWRQGDEIIAFGHPFLGAGPLRMPLVAADIQTVINSLQLSFKLGSPTAVVGELRGDELPGIVGRLGVEPTMIPFRIKVRRISIRYQDEYRFQLAAHPVLTPLLLKAAVGEVISAAAPAAEPTTVRVRTQMQLADYGPAFYEDVYAVTKGNFSDNFLEPVAFFASNPFERVGLEAVEIELDIVDELRVAAIESVWAESDEVEPGTTVEIGVMLRPYNEERVEIRLSVPVPKDLQEKNFKLKITGGNRGEPDHAVPRGIEDMISFMNAVYKADHLVVSYSASGQSVDVKGKRLRNLPPSVSSLLTPRNDTEAGDAPLMVILVKPTPYVIVGSQSLTLNLRTFDRGKGP